MSVVILKPRMNEAYDEAALCFKNMYQKVTGEIIEISDFDDRKSDLVVIGSDAVNDFVMNEIADFNIDSLKIRYGTDDYCIKGYKKDGRNILVLAGGRLRSTLYAIYGYFEKYLNCHYFWDGDIIPPSNSIPFDGIDDAESPRFEYRGLRYFAHRGLKRFQAEHWSFEDWKTELDWMVKKRLNFFMLRIGMDDVWQRAFPDDVPYPDEFKTVKEENAEGYNDRSDFWTLEYKGRLRAQILEYARKLDLMYPTDCGTMTHWYSRTPEEFLEKRKPEFAYQECNHYCESDTGRVWDFTKKENMDNYIRLTETMVNEYDKQTALFHTIGLGERNMYKDKRKNLAAKLIAYRRISESIREKYPNSKLMLASWDFVGWWSGEEVQKLLSELNPENTIVLDYTSDVSDPNESFLNWGVVGKFPWIFGLFHAYESESELRGAYDRSDERLKIAASDPYCKGMILWPELSHGDPLILEYLSENAWNPLNKNIEQITKEFCYSRYGENAEYMNKCWQKILPFIKLGDWGSYSHRKKGDEKFVEYCSNWYAHQDMWTKIAEFLRTDFWRYEIVRDYHFYKLKSVISMAEDITCALKMIAKSDEVLKNPFILRDSIDIARTVLGRFLNYIIVLALDALGNAERIDALKIKYLENLELMEQLLSLNDDFSIYKTLRYLKSVAPTNPDFEITIKRNIYNTYCAQPAYELMSLFKKEGEIAFEWLKTAKPEDRPNFTEALKPAREKFFSTPLEQMRPEKQLNFKDVILKVAKSVDDLTNIIK